MTSSALSTATDARHLTKQQFVYRMLRNAIIRCELKPGERLVIDDLARRFEISIIPVREALRLLQSEGLVVSVAHVGATVGPISRDSILEVFTVLEGLEVVATRTAAQRAHAAHIEAISRVVSAMDDALVEDAPQKWADLNTEFHLQIARATGMPVLLEMTQRALDLWDRVRRYYFKGVLLHRTHQAQAEHHVILDCLRSRDLETLEQAIRQHNRGALAAYTAYLESLDSEVAKESGL
jgi:DNA-binding GntR family transcriptional regulator